MTHIGYCTEGEARPHCQSAWQVDVSGMRAYRGVAVELFCQECLLLADDEARGWRLLRVDVPGEDDEPLLAAAYCPECAEREFGLGRRDHSSRADSA